MDDDLVVVLRRWAGTYSDGSAHDVTLILAAAERIERLEGAMEHVGELIAKVNYLVQWADGKGLLDDHCFTFPDGDTWWAAR